MFSFEIGAGWAEQRSLTVSVIPTQKVDNFLNAKSGLEYWQRSIGKPQMRNLPILVENSCNPCGEKPRVLANTIGKVVLANLEF